MRSRPIRGREFACHCSPHGSRRCGSASSPRSTRVARPLIEGLSTHTTVTDPSGAEPSTSSWCRSPRRSAGRSPRTPSSRSRMSAELRLYPDRLGKVPRTGAVESVQEAELRLDELASSVVNRGFLERDGARLLAADHPLDARVDLGDVRRRRPVRGADRCPFVLLRFHAPEYEVSEDRGSVIWRIKRGILVSREGRDNGSLRLAVAAADGAEERCCVHVAWRSRTSIRGSAAPARSHG